MLITARPSLLRLHVLVQGNNKVYRTKIKTCIIIIIIGNNNNNNNNSVKTTSDNITNICTYHPEQFQIYKGLFVRQYHCCPNTKGYHNPRWIKKKWKHINKQIVKCKKKEERMLS